MTRSQINRLGEKLRTAHPDFDETLLDQLQAFRGQFAAPLARAHELVTETLEIEPTARIKTVNTIVEKMVRAKTRLSTMQDIAGVRVVLDSDLDGQTAAVKRLTALFEGAEVEDLRDNARHGYRAVHVIAMVDGFS